MQRSQDNRHLWRSAADMVIPAAGPALADTDLTRTMITLRDKIGATSPLAAWLLDQADRAGVWIIADASVESGGSYDSTANVIALPIRHEQGKISETPDLAQLALVLVHELRHAWQYKHGGDLPDPTRYAPRDSLHMRFMAEADAEAHAALAAWQMKQAGWSEPAAMGISDVIHGDIHVALQDACTTIPAAARDGRALARAVASWFESDQRLRGYAEPLINWWHEINPPHLKHFPAWQNADEARVRAYGASLGTPDYFAAGRIKRLMADAWQKPLPAELHEKLMAAEARLTPRPQPPNQTRKP